MWVTSTGNVAGKLMGVRGASAGVVIGLVKVYIGRKLDRDAQIKEDE